MAYSHGSLEQVFTVTEESILKSGVNPDEIAAVSFSVQRSSCLLVDENGEALNNIMVWLDTRADETMVEIAYYYHLIPFFSMV